MVIITLCLSQWHSPQLVKLLLKLLPGAVMNSGSYVNLLPRGNTYKSEPFCHSFFLQNRPAVMDDQCVSHSSPQRCRDTESQRHGRPGVIRCGWLRKQGGFVKTWHSRWFVLRGEQLYYYKDEEETKALVRILTHWRHSMQQVSHCRAFHTFEVTNNQIRAETFVMNMYKHCDHWDMSQCLSQ